METTKEVVSDQTATATSGSYRIENIILINSQFSRIPNVDFSKNIVLNFEHASRVTDVPDESRFGVGLVFNIKGEYDEVVAFSASVEMVGVFEKVGEPALPEDAFKKINAPAIIYPFIREHIFSLCQKAAVGIVILPTVNFKI